jgi:hypothetical protein
LAQEQLYLNIDLLSSVLSPVKLMCYISVEGEAPLNNILENPRKHTATSLQKSVSLGMQSLVVLRTELNPETNCGRNVVLLNVTASGTNSYHCPIKGRYMDEPNMRWIEYYYLLGYNSV